MPGSPAKFKDRTLIIITGSSGIGKSTLASFLSQDRDDLKYLATDSFFNPHYVKKHKIKHPKYNESLELLNSISNPTAHVGNLSNSIDKDFFTKLVTNIIYRKFKKGYKCIILEGYTLKFIYKKLIYNIKKDHIRIWTLDSNKN